jgi:hypothetical protein
MDQYEGPHSALTIALHIGLCLDIIMDRYDGPHSALSIALQKGLYIDILINPYYGPTLPFIPVHYIA